MSVKIQSTSPRIAPNRQEPAAPVGPKAQAEKAPAPSPSSAAPEQAPDGFDQASAKTARQQEWATKFGADSQSVLQQTSDDNCGPAAALMAAGLKGGSGAAAAQRMAELESKFTDGNGTNAEQMSQMLAHEGVSVKQAAFKYDQYTVDQSLGQGGKMLAMVDSNQINPGANQQEAGSPHWVVVDGKDSQGNYTVKDPGTGSAYNVDFNALSNAVDHGWWKHQGGGMLLAEDAKGAASGAGLAMSNAAKIVPLPREDGGGSKGDMTLGRESSLE